MYYWRVFLWKGGHKSTEYTVYLTAPIFLEDKLDETLDSGEIILENMPTATRSEFPPKTKFRMERYSAADCTDEPKKWDMVVDHDDVEEHEGCPEICTHRIFLIEASVIAQGMHVDNIALTYKLQDVTLNYKTIVGVTDSVEDLGLIEANERGSATPIHTCPKMTSVVDEVRSGNIATISFTNSYRYKWTGIEKIKALKGFYHGETPIKLSFDLPTLTAQGAKNGDWINICEVPVEASITLDLLNANGNTISTQKSSRKYGSISRSESTVDEKIYKYGEKQGLSVPGSSSENRYVCYVTTISGFSSHSSHAAGLVTSINDLKEFENNLSSSPMHIISFEDSAYNDSKSVEITIPALTDEQIKLGRKYKLTITAKAVSSHNVDGQYVLPIFYECKCDVAIDQSGNYANNTSGLFTNNYKSNGYITRTNADEITFSVSVISQDRKQTIESYEFMRKKEKYNCYDLLRKAILTCDTNIVESSVGNVDSLPLIIEASDETKKMLTATSAHETTFEQKNLWEVLLQIGYYIHAIPYIEFAEDGDYFVLHYKRLGEQGNIKKESNKITVFNSRNLSDFFTQYDSYVTNMYSPQNIVYEYGVVKTSDSTYLVSNNTAEIHTTYPIIELLEFYIKLGDKEEWHDITNYIFEKSVYSVLSAYVGVTPSKGNSLYYTLGDNKILGLSYVPSTANGNVPLYAFKEIIKIATGKYQKYNDYKYRIKYRTQDSLRISQVRPDLQDFMKNSEREEYPHHEQYFGQQDKIIDSERFSANLFGKLIRVGNAVYQRQEYADAESEKESGDLVKINGEPYYVTATENEYYADAIFQKVTYSKNFNQLANIVTIPSEPRFYEVSERSQVRREIRIMDFLLLTTQTPSGSPELRFSHWGNWRDSIRYLIFSDGFAHVPNYAYTRYMGDITRYDKATYENLFPSSETRRVDENTIMPKESKPYSSVAVPVLRFPLKNAIVFEWDMADNFKAGDYIDQSNFGGNNDDEYLTMQSARYCDIFGGADLFGFELFESKELSLSQIQKLPILQERPIGIFGTYDKAIVLNKDNREALSFNYQINLLQESSEFVTYPNLFGDKQARLIMCFLNTEVNYLAETTELSNRTIIADNVEYSLMHVAHNAIEVVIQGTTYSDVKAIVLYEKDGNTKYPCIARNVAKCSSAKKKASWYIYPAFG